MGRCIWANLSYVLFTVFMSAFVVGCEREIDVIVKPTSIKILSEVPGWGPKIKDGDLATIKYLVTLPDGTELMKDDEFKFFVDSKRPTVIEGLNDSVLGMRIGGTRTIDCPPHLHWGRNGTGNGAIPANSNLLIHIKALNLQRQ